MCPAATVRSDGWTTACVSLWGRDLYVQTERPLWQSGLRVEPVVGRGAARHGRGAEREISICCVASIFLDS